MGLTSDLKTLAEPENQPTTLLRLTPPNLTSPKPDTPNQPQRTAPRKDPTMKIRPIRYHPANSPLPAPTRERPPPLRQRFLSGGLPTRPPLRRQPKPGRYDLDSGPPSERRKVKPPRACVRRCSFRVRGSSRRNAEKLNHLGPVVILTVIPTPPTVIPAQAGIYACRLHYRSRGCTTLDSGASRNDGCRGIAMLKTYAGL